MHNLWSRVWTTDDFETGRPLLGERADAKQKYFNGFTPEPYPDAITLGNESEIENGSSIESFCGWRFQQFNGATWALTGQDPKITFEDSWNCGGTNLSVQFGSASIAFASSVERKITLTLTGKVEQQNAGFDIGHVKLDGASVILQGGLSNGLGCSMYDTLNNYETTIAAGEHTIEFTGDTVDANYHVGAFFNLATVFDPPMATGEVALYQGFPEGCYLGQPAEKETIFLTPDILSRASQVFFAACMVDLYDDVTLAVARLQAYLGPTATVVGVANTAALTPGTVIGVRGDLTVVIIAGTSNFFQAACYSVFAVAGPTDFAFYSTNLIWKVAASEIVARVTAAAANPLGRVILVGHSYGGAVACLMAADYILWNPGRVVDCLSYGGAKPGDDRLAEILKDCRVVRISNEGDPVPSLPPNRQEILQYLTVLPLWAIGSWPELTQPTGQWVVFADGSKIESEITTLSFVYLATVIAAVLGGPALVQPFAHGSAEYLRRLLLTSDIA